MRVVTSLAHVCVSSSVATDMLRFEYLIFASEMHPQHCLVHSNTHNILLCMMDFDNDEEFDDEINTLFKIDFMYITRYDHIQSYIHNLTALTVTS